MVSRMRCQWELDIKNQFLSHGKGIVGKSGIVFGAWRFVVLAA